MEEYQREESERNSSCAAEVEEKKEKSTVDGAVFTLEDELCEEPYAAGTRGGYKTGVDAPAVYEEKRSYGPMRKMIGRIKTGRWGNWNDLITEIDGQDERGHL